MTYRGLIGVTGVAAWSLVGLPAFIYHAGTPTWNWGWVVAFVVFGSAFVADLRHPRFILLLAESGAALALILFRCNGYEGTLLVVLAMQLGSRLGRTTGLIWIVVQTLLLVATETMWLNLRAALLLAPPYLGFQLLGFFVFRIMTREMAARTELADTNAELRALQQVLAESSRIAERLRIAHELHDALGHRLTVLTLNLEAVLQFTQGSVKERVETCQSLARHVLADVREIVADSKTHGGVPVAQALSELVSAVPRPRVHLDVAQALRIFDPEGAHTLLRCVQEIMTNAARHSGAENLWIVVEQCGGSVRLRAHDDGRGSTAPSDGFGLRGMRERVEKAGGEIHFATQAGQGFGVTALFPMETGAA